MTAAANRNERYVHGYEEWTRQWMSQRTAARDLAFLIPHLRTGMDVVDCGCGPGSITVGLAEIVAPGNVIGVDIEPRQLETARALAFERGVGNVRFDQASVYELPYPDASFDVAVAHYVIEHVSEPVRALREIRRVLKTSIGYEFSPRTIRITRTRTRPMSVKRVGCEFADFGG